MKPARIIALIPLFMLLFALISCKGANDVPDAGAKSGMPDGAMTQTQTQSAGGGKTASANAESTPAGSLTTPESTGAQTETARPEQGETDMQNTLRMYINGTEVEVVWEDNESVKALAGLAADGGLTVRTSPYGGFEQVGPIGRSLPENDRQTTTGPGDVVLYSGNQLVLFYGSNSWAYTRLGRITGMTAAELRALLGNGGVTVTITSGG